MYGSEICRGCSNNTTGINPFTTGTYPITVDSELLPTKSREELIADYKRLIDILEKKPVGREDLQALIGDIRNMLLPLAMHEETKSMLNGIIERIERLKEKCS